LQKKRREIKRFWEEWQDEKRMLILSSIYNRTISLRREVIDANVRAIYRLKFDAKPGSVFGIQTAFHGVEDLGEKK
jgi:hypothetical protein